MQLWMPPPEPTSPTCCGGDAAGVLYETAHPDRVQQAGRADVHPAPGNPTTLGVTNCCTHYPTAGNRR